MDRVAPARVTVIITVNVRVGSPVCRCRELMCAAPTLLATLIIVAIVDRVVPGKATVTIMLNVRAVWSVFKFQAPTAARHHNCEDE